MNLRKARVENYRSIEDTTEFTLDRVTCLVGKNESGKTALLQSLYKLKPVIAEHSQFQELDYPRRRWSLYQSREDRQPATVLSTVWELEPSDRAALEDLLGPTALTSSEVSIAKGYDNQRSLTVLIDESRVVSHYVDAAGVDAIERTILAPFGTVGEIVSHLQALEARSEQQNGLLHSFLNAFPDTDVKLATAKLLDERLPTFLYFSSYGILPGQVAIDDLVQRKSNGQLRFGDRLFMALLDLVGTSPEQIHNIGQSEQLIAQLESVSNRISDEIFAYWSQNTYLEVDFRYDAARPGDRSPFNSGYVFKTRIENRRHRVTVGFDERSSGFTWFFSFLVWFSQMERNYGDNLIILLDEPGLSLHARAQADLLRYINERLAPRHQVVYSTHSPFMVDANNLLGVRTVEDLVTDDKVLGTKVGDKVLSTDQDTLFPLQAALGYDLTQTLFVGRHALLVEGPSDLLYMTWASRELKLAGRTGLDPRWVITPAGGLTKVSSFVTLFGGSQLHVAVFTDIQEGEKRKVRELRESTVLRQGHVFSADHYASQVEADIEDMIGRDFYVKLVNLCFELTGKNALDIKRPAAAPVRVVKEVEQQFAVLPPEAPTFDHYSPAAYLVQHAESIRDSSPGRDVALKRFEALFHDLNELLTGS